MKCCRLMLTGWMCTLLAVTVSSHHDDLSSARRECLSDYNCIDQCKDACGDNAECSTVNVTSSCSCRAGYTGDPRLGCIPLLSSENIINTNTSTQVLPSPSEGTSKHFSDELTSDTSIERVFNPSQTKAFTLEKSKLNWHDANLFCERKGQRLARVINEEDNNYIVNLIQNSAPKYQINGKIWIDGFCEKPNTYSCHWTNPWTKVSNSPFRQWHQGQPDQYQGNENCMSYWYRGGKWKWNDDACSEELHFICEYTSDTSIETVLNPSQKKEFTLEKSTLNWHDANLFCQLKGQRLARVINEEDHNYIVNLFSNSSDDSFDPTNLRDAIIWIGGFCEKANPNSCHWTNPWTNISDSQFSLWHQGQPDHANRFEGNEKCMSYWYIIEKWNWNDYTCSQEQNFVCESGPNIPVTAVYPNRKKKFILEKFQLNWFDANEFCRNKGGRLARQLSDIENQEIIQLLKQRDPPYNINDIIWIGGWCYEADRNSCFWTDPWLPMNSSYTDWHEEQPNFYSDTDYCLSYYVDPNRKTLKWNDGSCHKRVNFVCEMYV